MKSIHIRKIAKLLKTWNNETEATILAILEMYVISDPMMVKAILYHIEKSHECKNCIVVKKKLSNLALDMETADKLLSAVL